MSSKKSSIKWKIFLYLIAFCILLLIILWLFQTVLLDSFYKEIKTVEVKNGASVMMEYAVSEDWDALSRSIERRDDLYVEIWRENGSVFSSGRYPGGMQEHLSSLEKHELYELAAASGGGITEKYVFDEGFGRIAREGIIHAEIFTSASGAESLLIVSATITPLNATVDTLRVQLVIVSVLMVILATALALMMAKRVSSPIVKLNRAAKALGKGDYDASFRARGYREIEELSDTLNHAAGELKKTEALRQELIANTSHDLRTPLTLITGYSEMIRDFPEECNTENMQVIIDESKRLTGLVNDLLDLSKLQAGVDELKLERFCLTDSLQAITVRFSKLSSPVGAGVKLTADGRAHVLGDSRRLEQVMYNFLSNAAEHSGGDRDIAVVQEIGDGRVRVSVADSGKGIPADILPYIWERYYRAHGSKDDPEGGSGLGLYIVKTLLDKHPGALYGAESEEGRGSVFWFSLPLEDYPEE